jgi:hypothetical protein
MMVESGGLTMRKGIHPAAAILLLAAGIAGCSAGPSRSPRGEQHPHYSIDLKVDPTEQTIEVAGTLAFPRDETSPDSLVFYLHEQLELKSLGPAGAPDLGFESGESDIRFLPRARRIVVRSGEGQRRAGVAEIDFAYGGRITDWPGWSANVIGADWTEIGLYFPWFPYNADWGVFTYDLNVACDPGYELVSLGEIRRTEEGWRVSCPDPTNDIVVCLAADLEIHEADLGGNRLRICHFGIPDSTLSALSADIAATMRTFGQWFGAVGRDVWVVESRRAKGGGYGRIGGIFLGGFDGDAYGADRESYNRYLAHELAHQWWYRAPASSWEDWLNESFAEYSALSLIREAFGADSFGERLAEKAEGLAGTPPVWGFDRSGDPAAQRILYDKGPVLLSRLEDRIGRQGFRQLCARAFGDGIAASADLLDLLEAREGPTTRAWFEDLLRTW